MILLVRVTAKKVLPGKTGGTAGGETCAGNYPRGDLRYRWTRMLGLRTTQMTNLSASHGCFMILLWFFTYSSSAALIHTRMPRCTAGICRLIMDCPASHLNKAFPCLSAHHPSSIWKTQRNMCATPKVTSFTILHEAVGGVCKHQITHTPSRWSHPIHFGEPGSAWDAVGGMKSPKSPLNIPKTNGMPIQIQTHILIELSLNIVESYCGRNTKTSIACQEKDVIFLKS